MKPTTILFSALATLVAAAPTPAEKAVEQRSLFNIGSVSQFGNQNFNYLSSISGFDLGLVQQLALQQNLNVDIFGGLFAQDAIFDINSLLLLQQLNFVSHLAGIGLFNNFDLAGLNFGNGFALNLGVLQNGIGNFGLANLIQANQLSQIQAVTSSLILA